MWGRFELNSAVVLQEHICGTLIYGLWSKVKQRSWGTHLVSCSPAEKGRCGSKEGAVESAYGGGSPSHCESGCAPRPAPVDPSWARPAWGWCCGSSSCRQVTRGGGKGGEREGGKGREGWGVTWGSVPPPHWQGTPQSRYQARVMVRALSHMHTCVRIYTHTRTYAREPGVTRGGAGGRAQWRAGWLEVGVGALGWAVLWGITLGWNKSRRPPAKHPDSCATKGTLRRQALQGWEKRGTAGWEWGEKSE